MIIGDGLIAQAFKIFENNLNILIFASGVSNSKETNPLEFEREKKLLIEAIKNNQQKILVYFSTTSIYDLELNSNPYVKHKQEMEMLIKSKSQLFYIFRLSEVIGKTKNQKTIINFLFNSIKEKEEFQLWTRACRRIIDVEDVFSIATEIIRKGIYCNQIVNISVDKKSYITELVYIIEDILKIKANYSIINKGCCYDVDIEKIKILDAFKKVKLNESYTKEVILKYLK